MVDIFQLWTKSINNPSTRRHYSNSLWSLLTKVGLTPQEALNKIKAESKESDATTYSQLVQYAKGNFTKHTAYTMVMALRRFLFDNGVVLLPPSRMSVPGKVNPSTSMTWEQANRIVDAASKPYNLVLKLMLHCGWGIHEFCMFNTQTTWTSIKSYLPSKPTAEYFRFNFSGRKKSTHEWFTLIPVEILREILANVTVPLQTNTGLILNMTHYLDTQKYLGSAFNTALKRAPVQVQGKPTVHEMRDTFITRGIFVGASDAVTQFALGHMPDKEGYKKAFTDEAFTWKELKKIYGPTAVTPNELQERDKNRAVDEPKH